MLFQTVLGGLEKISTQSLGKRSLQVEKSSGEKWVFGVFFCKIDVFCRLKRNANFGSFYYKMQGNQQGQNGTFLQKHVFLIRKTCRLIIFQVLICPKVSPMLESNFRLKRKPHVYFLLIGSGEAILV